MTETEAKPNITVEETPVANLTADPVAKEDIPAVDADEVKNSDETDNNKPAEKKDEEKVSEVPKNPREDPVGWLNSLFPAAVHKVNYQLLDWAQQLAVEDEAQRSRLPGKNDAVTKNQFLSFLRNGSLLAKLANRLQPGAIGTVHDGEHANEKSKQIENINQFITFAKEKAGLTDEQVFTVEDLQEKGKAGYQAVFNTLLQLGVKAQESFEQKGVDIDQIVQIASQTTQSSLVQTILNFFRRARPAQSPKKLAKEAEETEKVEKVVEEKEAVTEEVCKKVDAQGSTNIDAPPAIPAN